MAIAMLVDNPEGSRELYDRIRKQLELEAPAGGILHVAGPSPNGGWRVIEVFESKRTPAASCRSASARPSRPSGSPAGAGAAALARPQLHEVGGSRGGRQWRCVC